MHHLFWENNTGVHKQMVGSTTTFFFIIIIII